MNRKRLGLCVLAVGAVVLAPSLARAACTATFTADGSGTFGDTFEYDRRTKVLTVDLSGIPAGARIFRAELILNGPRRFAEAPITPTTVYPAGQPEKKLSFVAPRFVSLDALEAVAAAVAAKQPLKLKLEVTLAGAKRLEVSYSGGQPRSRAVPPVSGLRVIHRAGQSLIVFKEPTVKAAGAVAAPFDGDLKSVEVDLGQTVKKGDLLARMDTAALKAQLAEAEAERDRCRQQHDQAVREGKTAEVQAAKARVQKAEGRVKSLADRIARADLRAPIDGTVVVGDLKGKVPAAVKSGKTLFEVERELAAGAYPELETGGQVSLLRQQILSRNPGVTFRIWRGPEKITAETIAKARLVGECGFTTCWNSGYHQGGTGGARPIRYRVTDGGQEVPWGTGVYAHNPALAGKAYYAVTTAVNGEEDLASFNDGNTTAEAVEETVGMGDPILQWIERFPADPDEKDRRKWGWHYRTGPLTRLIYTRWESWPHSATPSKPIDYLVAMGDKPLPEKRPGEWAQHAWRVEPAPVGLHLHCWGGSLNGGYGWWYNAHRGAVLIASNQIPYDWWTGYHEANGTCKTHGDGYVRPFTMNRTLGILEWASRQWKEAPESVREHWRKLDLTRVFTAGSSMGGSGAPMFAIRYGGRIAWCMAWVGVHIPAESPQFTGSYRGNYGPQNPLIKMPDGETSPWDHFSDVWWLRNHVKPDIGFIMASNGKSDGAIGWPQAYKFARALQETRRPHIFNWGPGGHGTRTLIGANFDLDVRTDQTLPAFTNCTLDEDIGTGRIKTNAEREAERKALVAKAIEAGKDPGTVHVLPTDGDPAGAYNAHVWWQTDDVVDEPGAWEMTVVLKATAGKDSCKLDLTPRRLQRFRTANGQRFRYTVTDVQANVILARGTATADEYDLLTLKQIPLVKGRNRVQIVPAR